jgi:hypothetical protein
VRSRINSSRATERIEDFVAWSSGTSQEVTVHSDGFLGGMAKVIFHTGLVDDVRVNCSDPSIPSMSVQDKFILPSRAMFR